MTWLETRYFEEGRLEQGIDFDGLEANRVQHIVERLVAECESRVRQASRRWSASIRSFLRSESGLKLSYQKRTERIPVKVIPGVPAGVFLIPGEIDEEKFRLWLQRWRVSLAIGGIEFLREEQELLENVAPKGLLPVPISSLLETRSWAGEVYAWLQSLKPPAVEIVLDPDILGAYWWHDGRVTLHWVPIGLASLILRTDPEDLVPVVLCHELAHAFHHRGFDIDGRRWTTDSFRASDLEVVEGVAQFYTWLFSDLSGANGRAVLDAWEKLEQAAPALYRGYRDWLPALTDGGRSREIMRAAMLSTRMQNPNPVTRNGFERAIEDARSAVMRSES